MKTLWISLVAACMAAGLCNADPVEPPKSGSNPAPSKDPGIVIPPKLVTPEPNVILPPKKVEPKSDIVKPPVEAVPDKNVIPPPKNVEPLPPVVPPPGPKKT